MKAAIQSYYARMQKVLDYIDWHVGDVLDLEALSSVAAFSKYHFHRQLTATFGLPVYRDVQLARLKHASQQLARGDAKDVTDIAMDARYYAPDAFARAFRRRLEQSQSAFRQSPDWSSWLAAFGPLDNARNKIMQISFEQSDVTIRNLPAVPVAIMEHRGDRSRLPETIRRFREWRTAVGVKPEASSTFVLFRSERSPQNPADYSVDICAEAREPMVSDGSVQSGVIPAARCSATPETPTTWSWPFNISTRIGCQ